MITFTAVAFEDINTGERWDYGEYSLFRNKTHAIKDLNENAGTVQENATGIILTDDDGNPTIVHLTEMSRVEAEAANLHIPS